MNPELLRNLWLEASPIRLALIAGLVLLVFAAASAVPPQWGSAESAAQVLYWFFVVLWGTRNAALSVVAEIRERTWDGQKLSSIGPVQMMWGKLLGSTAANWFGGLLCLPPMVAPVLAGQGPRAALLYAGMMLALGLFAQAAALLSSLMLVRRNTGNWRLDTFLCQVAGIAAAFSYFTLWRSLDAFQTSGAETLVWWGQVFNLRAFHLVSLMVFLTWALIGCWRMMRAELRFANGPFVWLAYLAFLCVYEAGFAPWLVHRLHLDAAPLFDTILRLVMAVFTLTATTYSMVFLEPKGPVRMRWLGEQLRAEHLRRAFLALDAWMLSYGAALAASLVLVALLMARGSPLVLPAAALPGFLTRDVAIFVLVRGVAQGKGDLAALAILGALYVLVPLILRGAGLEALLALFLPRLGAPPLTVIAAWAQGLVMAWLALRSIRPGIREKLKAA